MNNKKEVFMKKMLSVVGMLVVILSSVVVNQLVAEESSNVEATVSEPIGGPGIGPGFGPNRPFKPGIGPRKMKGPRAGFDPGIAEDKVLDIIKKNDPSLYNKVSDLKKNDSVKYDHFIRMAFNMFSMTKDLDADIDKDITRAISLEWDTMELSQKYQKATDTEKTNIKNKIESKLNEIFDIRTKIMELRVKKVENHLKELKSNLEERKKNKDAIVNERLQQILERKKHLNW
jgi:peptidoglycan hydrolase CwlO-like protein